jgi:putative thioredoxin
MESIIGRPTPPGTGDPAGLIKDGTAASFMQDVIEASRHAVVLVDFWAPWCGPCKQLGPTLEKLVTAAKGAVRLVKINVDAEPAIAQQLRIQSIPTVYAFKNGQPIDGFQGALPESQLKQFIQNLTGPQGPGEIDAVLEAAEQALASGDLGGAQMLYSQACEMEPENPKALAGLAQVLIGAKEFDAAAQVLAQVPKEHDNHTAVVAARAALELAQQTKDTGDLHALRAAVEKNPADYQARYDLALALTAAGDHQGAADHLLEIVRLNRAWNDDAARQQLIKMFEAMGPTSPFTLTNRRRLSSLLFA